MEPVTKNIPALALRGLVVFPRVNASLDLERIVSMRALERAMETDQELFVVTQREVGVESPQEGDLYTVGTLVHIAQVLRVSDHVIRIIVEGKRRARLRRLWQREPFLQAQIELLDDPKTVRVGTRTEALLRQTYANFGEYVELTQNLTAEILATVFGCTEPGFLADFIAQHINIRYQDKQTILEELSPLQRLRKINEILCRETEVIALEQEIDDKVRSRVGRIHRDFVLREQIKVLQNELGEGGEDEEIEEYRDHILALKLPEETEKKLLKDVDRLSKQSYSSSEASVLRSYLDTVLELPWHKETKERASVDAARKILERDHFGMEKVKERILEFIAVRALKKDAKGQVLCLVGPPGVGKTSIALSVAKAMNRKVARLSLGGVRDEADIRGHRKTYIGAMPGRIVEAIGRSGSMNPLLVLDEIDKLGSDHRGDPASALLEVLDAEQNHAFRDHYLEIPLDLSRVMFIMTANTTDTIPRPLLDRMEVIELPSYTDEEKVQIALRHLFPKQKEAHGVPKSALRLDEDALRAVISQYTRESGVRQLERQLAKLCRKTAMVLNQGEVKHVTVTADNLSEYLGVPRYIHEKTSGKDLVGVVNGLAWTQAGGEILPVEVNVMDGSGKLELTGNLGEVMQESCRAALSCLRTRTVELGIEPEFYKTKDIHVHFPEGAVPKDGPSAGIAITTALLSALTGRAARRDVAMTGEVTLRGRVMPIGGLREKTMAALRAGLHTVILPLENEKDLDDIDQSVRAKLRFVTVETVDAVFAEALVLPETLSGKGLDEAFLDQGDSILVPALRV
ncbi:MAG: endopeptidase La [Ruminococcaceae bacterium]|jgi:ATP-dependent Lon protease|nr:endopeptidase La [Oscillospiraceae bacterium]